MSKEIYTKNRQIDKQETWEDELLPYSDTDRVRLCCNLSEKNKAAQCGHMLVLLNGRHSRMYFYGLLEMMAKEGRGKQITKNILGHESDRLGNAGE